MIRFSICNEIFGDMPFPDVCQIVSEIGYDGIELAPFVFHEDPRLISREQRREIRESAESHGLAIAGLHWLLVSPDGLHLTTDDHAVAEETLGFLESLFDLCADVGGKVLILGSPKQRGLEPHQNRHEVEERMVRHFRRLGQAAMERDVILCIEPLDASQGNFINTPAEAFEFVQRVDSPGFQMMIDCRSTFAMGLEPAEELEHYASAVKHVHLNDTNLLGPGMGSCQYDQLFQVAGDVDFDGFFSVEAFDASPGAEQIARASFETIARLKKLVPCLQ